MDEFNQYFDGNLDSEGEEYFYEQAVENDLEAMILSFSSSVFGCRIFQEEEGLFQMKGQILDDGRSKYSVNSRYSFERRYGELTYDPATLARELSLTEQDGDALGTEVLGIGFLENPRDGEVQGMAASYAENSTAREPVIKVDFMPPGDPEAHCIYINQVNVENATEIEMFALCSHMDAAGQGTVGKFGTWQTLNYFRQIANFNGYFELTNNIDKFDSLRQNWLAMAIRMNADNERAGLEKQWRDGKALIRLLGGGNLVGSGVAEGVPVPRAGKSAADPAVDDGLLLTNETSRCSYPPPGKDEEEIRYIVCYTRYGILCKRAGERGAIWKLPYQRKRDFRRVMKFLRQFAPDENLRFAAHKNFWRDYLSGETDEKDFLDFFSRTENGIPNYLLTTEEGIYVDYESLKYQKYFAHNSIADPNPELLDFVNNFQPALEESGKWKKEQYYTGRRHTASEIYQLSKRELMELFEENERERAG